MRLFLAITFDKQMNKVLTTAMHELKVQGIKGNYVPAQNLHMTLAFLGETDKLTEIKNVIGSIPVPTMRISLDRLGKYKDIILAEVKGNQKLKEYVADVRSALDAAGIDFDHKKFTPHITLIRKAGGFQDISLPKTSVTVKHVSLMKSVRKDGKMVYTEVAGWGGK